MTRFLITFSYDGSNFSGYQRQPNIRTIQEELEKALQKINNNTAVNFYSAGRTDKGVHALNQVGHVDLNVDITPYKLKRALNSNLSDEIHVLSTEIVDKNFHTRFHVEKKEYVYFLNMGEYNPIVRNYVYQYNYYLNVKAMQEAIICFKGKHDFRPFVTENNLKENCIRTIYQAKIITNKCDQNIIEFHFVGDGFMKYQIRNMVGLLLRIGQANEDCSIVKDVLDGVKKLKSNYRVPAAGLCLFKIKLKSLEN